MSMGRHTRSRTVATRALLVTSVALLAGSATAVAASAPTTAQAGLVFLRAQCTPGSPSASGYLAIGKARTTVLSVPQTDKTHYQRVSISIEVLRLGNTWGTLEKRTVSWGKFTAKQTPIYSTPGVKSAVGPTIVAGGTMRVTVHVELKQVRRGPDKTVWEYRNSTGAFTCPLQGGIGI